MGKRVLFVSTHGIGDLAMQFSGMGESFDSFEMTFIVTGEIEAKFEISITLRRQFSL